MTETDIQKPALKPNSAKAKSEIGPAVEVSEQGAKPQDADQAKSNPSYGWFYGCGCGCGRGDDAPYV